MVHIHHVNILTDTSAEGLQRAVNQRLKELREDYYEIVSIQFQTRLAVYVVLIHYAVKV